MGCDIHCYIEYRPKSGDRWRPFGTRINPGRIYGIFGRLAGVRCEGQLIPARGMPTDAAWAANGDYWLYITKDGGESCATPEQAARWAKHRSVYRNHADGTPAWISHPDWHSPSWCSPEEWKTATVDLPTEYVYPAEYVQYRAMYAAMKALEDDGANEARVVFWFDN